MTFMTRLRAAQQGEAGAALLTVLMAGAVLTASALVAVNISLTNLRNAGRDRVAGGAMGAAEGGIAEAINFLETHRADQIATWGTQTIAFPDGGTATVRIEVIEAIDPPD